MLECDALFAFIFSHGIAVSVGMVSWRRGIACPPKFRVTDSASGCLPGYKDKHATAESGVGRSLENTLQAGAPFVVC